MDDVLEIRQLETETLQELLARAKDAMRGTNRPVVLVTPELPHLWNKAIHIPHFSPWYLDDIRRYAQEKIDQGNARYQKNLGVYLSDASRICLTQDVSVPVTPDTDIADLRQFFQDRLEKNALVVLTQLYDGPLREHAFDRIDALVKANRVWAAIDTIRDTRQLKQQLFKNPPADFASVAQAPEVHVWLRGALSIAFNHDSSLRYNIQTFEQENVGPQHVQNSLYWVVNEKDQRIPPDMLFMIKDWSQLKLAGVDLRVPKTFQTREITRHFEQFFAAQPQHAVPDDFDVGHACFEAFEDAKKDKGVFSNDDIRDANLTLIKLYMYGKQRGSDESAAMGRIFRITHAKSAVLTPA